MVLFVGGRGGGIGKFLGLLERKGFDVWYYGDEFPKLRNRYDAVVINGYIPDFDFEVFKGTKKFFFFHGLRELSRRMVLGKREYNPFRLYKLRKFKIWLRNFDDFLAPSFSMAEICRNIYGVYPKVVHLGLDFKTMEKVKFKERKRAVLWVGRDAWIKGFDRFKKLVDMIDFEGWVVGLEGKDNDKLRFFGYVDNLYEIYRSVSATVITSYYESFSYTTLESLYYETPVFVLKSASGSWEILQILGLYEYGFDGLEDMAEGIRLRAEPVKVNLEYFSIDRSVERLEKIFNYG